MRKRIGLRSVVAALVFSLVAPLGAVAVFLVQRAWTRQLSNLERQNISTARAISVAVDREVERTAAALDVLGELHALDGPDLPAFETLAGRLLPSQPDWSAILLMDATGRVVDGVPDRADGGVLAGSTPWAVTAASSKAVTVSNLFELPDVGGHFLMIGVPVIRNGHVTLVLGARIKTEGLNATLREQQAPPNGAVALIDGTSRVIARTSGDDYVGTPVSAALADASVRASEGSWRGAGRDGTDNYAAFSRSARTGLMVALGLPTEEIDGPIRRILWTLAGWWVVVLGTGAGLGLLLGGVVVRAMTAASRASMALAEGERIALSSSRIAEIDDLATGLRQASAALEARNRERDEASRIKDEFLMTVSHELRTPLTAICGWSRMLTTGHIRDAQRGHALEAIDRNASALRQLVDDLLDVSRIVAGRLRLDVQPVALGDVIGAAVDSVRPAADAKGIDIATRIDTRASSVNGDSGRLQQVMWNLLSNAVRFTPSGGHIEITAEPVDGDVEIAVIDSGSGVKPEFLPHVFERFRQGESGPTRAHGGLGLGLAIVRHLVELHGGTVRAENNTSRPGAAFRIRLPLRVSAVDGRDDGAAIGHRPHEVRAPARLDRLNVLVVDDDPHARDLFAAALEHAGAEVKAAQSVTDALVVLETWSPDALLLDIDMPNQDINSLVRQVRARHLVDSTFVAIAVTARSRPDDRRRTIDAGFQWHLSKPIDPDELVSVLATLRAPAADVA